MKRNILFAVIAVALIGSGVLVWRQIETRANAERVESEILKGLTEDEVRLILESQKQSDLETVSTISATVESRRGFLDGLKEHLALAAEARREGLNEDAYFKRNLAYKENILIGELYKTKLSAELGKPFVVPNEDLEAVLNDAGNSREAEADLNALREIQTAVSKVKDDGFVPPALKGEALARARANWARTKILSDRARADAEFMGRPELRLRLRVLEAGILSSDYLRTHWNTDIKATEKEIADYLSSHPEYDLAAKVRLAENVLTRALNGENFDALAKEFSEHRPSKPSGGSMEITLAGGDWPELIEALKALSPGAVSSSLIRTEYGVHIVKLVGRKDVGKSTEAVSIQQILFQNKFPQPGIDPSIPAPFMTAVEIARLAIEKQKRDAFVTAIVERNPIQMPEDFTILN